MRAAAAHVRSANDTMSDQFFSSAPFGGGMMPGGPAGVTGFSLQQAPFVTGRPGMGMVPRGIQGDSVANGMGGTGLITTYDSGTPDTNSAVSQAIMCDELPDATQEKFREGYCLFANNPRARTNADGRYYLADIPAVNSWLREAVYKNAGAQFASAMGGDLGSSLGTGDYARPAKRAFVLPGDLPDAKYALTVPEAVHTWQWIGCMESDDSFKGSREKLFMIAYLGRQRIPQLAPDMRIGDRIAIQYYDAEFTTPILYDRDGNFVASLNTRAQARGVQVRMINLRQRRKAFDTTRAYNAPTTSRIVRAPLVRGVPDVSPKELQAAIANNSQSVVSSALRNCPRTPAHTVYIGTVTELHGIAPAAATIRAAHLKRDRYDNLFAKSYAIIQVNTRTANFGVNSPLE